MIIAICIGNDHHITGGKKDDKRNARIFQRMHERGTENGYYLKQPREHQRYWLQERQDFLSKNSQSGGSNGRRTRKYNY